MFENLSLVALPVLVVLALVVFMPYYTRGDL